MGCYYKFNFSKEETPVLVILEEQTEDTTVFVHEGKKTRMKTNLFEKNFTELPKEESEVDV